MESVSGSDVRLLRVGAVGLGHRGKTRVRAREEPMVRWQRGEGVGHGTATHGGHMEIIVKFGEALPCVKSPVSRTSGAIYVVM